MNLPRKPVVVLICLAVGALHLVTGPDYHGPFRAFVDGYLIDLALPFSLVLLLGVGLNKLPRLRSPLFRGTVVFLVGLTVEVFQYLGIPFLGRTFDPWDILMYALGAIAGLAFERVVFAETSKNSNV